MRVAFDPSSMRGTKTGIGVYTENLIAALRRFAPEIELLALDDDAEANQRTDRRILREQLTLPRLASRAKPDILHLSGFAAPWRAPCPVVLNAHDLVGVLFARNFPPVARFYWSRYLPYTLRFARRLVVLSEHTRDDVVRLAGIPPARIAVIPPGVDERFHPLQDAALLESTRARFRLPARFILFVSTLEPRKGVDTLIAAFERAAGRIPHDLVIVGKRGWFWERISTLVERAGLGPRIQFLEYLPYSDLPLVYNLADMFVFPSRYEGFGLTPLEAMASGTPVISSNASSLPEVVGSAGILLPPDDPGAFCRAMLELAESRATREELRARGLERASTFTWERAARRTVELYRSL